MTDSMKILFAREMKARTILLIYTIVIIFVSLVASFGIALSQIQLLAQSNINPNQFILRTGIAAVAILFTAGILYAYLSWIYIGKPIQRIRETANRLVEDESSLGEQIAEPDGADVRELTRSFNQLSVNMKKYIDEVEQKITERTRLLEEGSRLVQEVLDTTPNLLCLMNTEIDQFNYVNREFTDFFGVNNEEMIDLGPAFLRGRIFPADQQVFKHHEEKILESSADEVTQSDFRLANAGGEWRWLSLRSVTFQRNRDNLPKLVLHVGQDITDLKLSEEKLRFLSIHDQLTGLYNRLYFDEEMARLERGRIFPISVIMGDLDDLKIINDTYGHAQGDEVIKAAAQILRSSFRAEDVVARIGGDEFAALLPGANAEATQHVIARIQEKIRNHPMINHKVALYISLGSATAEKGTLLGDALRMADEQMYQHKQENKHTNGK
jgi:diguanylate cyclase (GGDEF)-like protein/PAS domain S-box-containing protein